MFCYLYYIFINSRKIEILYMVTSSNWNYILCRPTSEGCLPKLLNYCAVAV